ncbi:MAG: NUDIX hydrolase [Gemmatimonadota bacterium]|nr:NUDIX hydrolase [Gemmatimonadota bacterium]
MADDVPKVHVGKVESRRAYSGRVISLDVDRVRFPDGSIGELEMIRHPGASAIVPFLTNPHGDEPQILLIRQYRYAADGVIYEVPAGRLDPGESPETCARRELTEETGCTAEHVEHLYTMFTTPGFTDEKIHVFVATGLTRGKSKLERDEFVEVVAVTLTAALEMVKRGEISDAKTALSLLYVTGFYLGR